MTPENIFTPGLEQSENHYFGATNGSYTERDRKYDRDLYGGTVTPC